MKNGIEYLFIDAAYLNFRLKTWSKYFNEEKIDIDFYTFTKAYDKVFYYDGVSDDDANKNNSLNCLREIPNFHVLTGTIKGEGKKKRQKQVDILIAVNMLMHTIRKNMNHCTLLAGDEDFKPLIDALIQEGMNVTIWADKASASKNLLYSADRIKELSLMEVWRSSTKDFQIKFPYPKIYNMPLTEKHSMIYNHKRRGHIDKKDVFDLSKNDKISISIETQRDQGSVSYENITVNSEEELNRYLTIHNLKIQWDELTLSKMD